MKFNQISLLISAALAISFASAATASPALVKRSELSNRAVQPQASTNGFATRATSSSASLESYAEQQLRDPSLTKTEIVAGLTKKLNHADKKPLKSLYNDLDVASPSVKDLKKDVASINAVLSDFHSAISAINQDSSVSSQKVSDADAQNLKKALAKISTHFNYIHTTPKLNAIEKAQIFAQSQDGGALAGTIKYLEQDLKGLLDTLDTTVSGVLEDVLTPLLAIVDIIAHAA